VCVCVCVCLFVFMCLLACACVVVHVCVLRFMHELRCYFPAQLVCWSKWITCATTEKSSLRTIHGPVCTDDCFHIDPTAEKASRRTLQQWEKTLHPPKATDRKCCLVSASDSASIMIRRQREREVNFIFFPRTYSMNTSWIEPLTSTTHRFQQRSEHFKNLPPTEPVHL